ncbi:MAG: class I adenylate-forming enzyme family protein [Acidimicrobiia bacterium]
MSDDLDDEYTARLRAHGLIAAPNRLAIPGGGPQTVAAVVDRAARERPDDEALVGRYSRHSFREVDELANQAAAALAALGVRPGDRVAASLANHPDLVVMFLAAMRLGAIWVGINRPLAAPEKRYLLSDCQASVFIADAETVAEVGGRRSEVPDLDHLVVVDPSDPACEWHSMVRANAGASRPTVDIDPFAPAAIAYTSGTTGYPKGAVHSQHNVMVVATCSPHATSQPPGLRAGVCLPLTILNLMILSPATSLMHGFPLVCVDRVDAVGFADWIERERIHLVSLVPTILHDLITNPAVDPKQLETLGPPVVGGAECPPAWRALFEERGIHITNGYGMTEAPTGMTRQYPGDPRPPGSCGKPIPQLAVTIVDEDDNRLGPGEIGEVCMYANPTGPFANVYTPMLGYWNKPEESAKALRNGLLHTGDIGSLDADGILTLRDRRNELILRGGSNVYPAEVERVLAQDLRVGGAAVFGMPHDRLGEHVVAVVELMPGTTATEDELRDHCRRELARYKVPDRILFAPLPRNQMNKVRKRDLRALFE